MRFAIIILAAMSLLGGCSTTLKPRPIDPPTSADIEASIDRGTRWLIEHQNPDGSWGSARRTKDLNIFAPVPGAHDAFRAATTSLCISALIETGSEDAAVDAAIDRAEAWLIVNLPKVRRANMAAIYNVWTHAYATQALVRLLDRHADDKFSVRQILGQLVDSQIDRLARYEMLEGGWGYYDFYSHTQRPSGLAMSFTTATGLIALYEARQAGFNVPQDMVDRGLTALRRMQKPDFTYVYSYPHQKVPMRPVSRPGGSLGRSQTCNAALRLWGDAEITDQVLTTWLDRLFARNGFLSNGRKRPIPHEAPFQVAGYFYFYGHYYAGVCIELLPPNQQQKFQNYLAHTLIGVQESDGSWFDYPLYDYGHAYGTAFGVMAMTRCRQDTHSLAMLTHD